MQESEAFVRLLEHETMLGKTKFIITESITQNILIKCADNTLELNRFGHYFKIVWDIIRLKGDTSKLDLTKCRNWAEGITLEHDVSWATCESQPMHLPITQEQIYEWHHKLNQALVNGEVKFVPFNQMRYAAQELK